MRDVLLDTNLLLLLVVGSSDTTSVPLFKRTSHFAESDFHLLQSELRRYRNAFTTPSILAETSNLLRADVHIAVARAMTELYLGFLEVWNQRKT